MIIDHVFLCPRCKGKTGGSLEVRGAERPTIKTGHKGPTQWCMEKAEANRPVLKDCTCLFLHLKNKSCPPHSKIASEKDNIGSTHFRPDGY